MSTEKKHIFFPGDGVLFTINNRKRTWPFFDKHNDRWENRVPFAPNFRRLVSIQIVEINPNSAMNIFQCRFLQFENCRFWLQTGGFFLRRFRKLPLLRQRKWTCNTQCIYVCTCCTSILISALCNFLWCVAISAHVAKIVLWAFYK